MTRFEAQRPEGDRKAQRPEGERKAQQPDGNRKARVPDDSELVEQARTGSQAAFRSLFDRYHARIYRLAASLTGSSDDAHDLAQQTFIRAFSSLAGFKQQSSFYTWLYRIALNATTDYRRKQARKLETEAAWESPESLRGLEKTAAPAEQSPDEQVYRRELAAAIRKAIGTLSREHREILVLREINGLSYSEIAEITGLEPGTVMSRLHYARKNLAATLRQWNISDRDSCNI
ncbi:MAG: sigma-70 family RNA polymerase sigma factor [Candidatus Glassbacteria bacterium]|nr:sigma-70 family RNA polymerase sigma factor [Candidatus Glassbacteria bacterium]